LFRYNFRFLTTPSSSLPDVNDSNLDAFVGMLPFVAELHKFATLGTTLPTCHDGSYVTIVVWIPLSITTLGILQILAGIPCDLSVSVHEL
jgi:hypothetical protein